MIDKAEAQRMREDGMSLREIGSALGCTGERVRQIVGPAPRPTKCVGCGAGLSQTKAGRPRKWCSEDCRRRAWDEAHPNLCSCGKRIGRRSKQCFDCTLARNELARTAMWTHIQTLWNAGFSATEIAPKVGYANYNALGVQMDRMRKAGWDIPPHRAGWTGDYTPKGPPRREPKTRQQVNARVGDAIRRGRLVRPDRCERCDREGHVDAHHADYSKPLDVEWLCRTCHVAHHRAERIAA